MSAELRAPAPLALTPDAVAAHGSSAGVPTPTLEALLARAHAARRETALWAGALAAATRHDTVLRRWLGHVAEKPEAPALRALAAGGAPADIALDRATLALLARAAGAALVARGHAPGDVVAILAGNGLLWPVLDLGALLVGGVVAGLFPTCTAAQAADLVRDSGARLVACDAPAQAAKLADLTGVELVVAGAPDGHDESDARQTAVGPGDAWTTFLARGLALLDDPSVAAEVDRRAAAVAPDDLAALIHTSGSTGEAKGARIPHAYLLASAESVRDTLGLRADDRSLAMLPFAHAAERVFGHATRLVVGMEGGLVADASRVWEAARAFRPTLFGGLPRFWEKLHAAVVAERASGGDAADVRRVVAHHLGDAARLCTSGGAPLPTAVAEGLRAAGVHVLGAYGQTEHLCISFHHPGEAGFDGVGRPMPGTEVRIASDGEILVRRSALTFAGYHARPDATRDAFTADGQWLRTGDLGTLDARGRLHVTGRKKEVLALSTGKKVAPLPIEARLTAHPLVAHAVVLGEGRRFAAALLFVPPERAADASPAVLAEALAPHVATVNAALAPHERVVRHAVVVAALDDASGLLTPTLKVRRAAVAARFAPQVEALFA